MPKIKKIIKQYFTCKINDEINPDEVVAYGATIQAAMLLTMGKNNLLNGVRLYDITPFSLGTDVVNKNNDPKIKALGNLMSVIIPKWTKIPYSNQKLYKTVRDDQDSIQICVFEGENDYLKYNNLLGKFYLKNLPKKPKGVIQIKVNFEIDDNNILTVKASEQSKNISDKIIIESSNKKNKDNKLSLKNVDYIKMSENEKIIKANEKKIENLLKKYLKKKNNNKDKIRILEDYCVDIKENIKALIPEEKPENINENIIEKYFYYVYQLLECFEEILYLDESNEKENNILSEIKYYINNFKMQSTYYIKQIIDLFKGAKKEVFLPILLYSMQALNESGNNYLNKKRKFSRYYSKLYFEEIIRLYKKYKSYITLKQFKTDIDEIEKNCEKNLNMINSNIIALLHNSKNNKKLISYLNKSINNNLKWGADREECKESLFTYLDKMVNPDINEDYSIILDELYRMLNEISISIINTEDENSRNELIEEKGICLGNIVKIKYTYQREEDYEKFKKLIDDSVECGRICNKNINNCEWYKEAIELQKELEENINNDLENDEEIKKEIQDKIDQIDSLFDLNDKQRFIDSILEDFPYDGYDYENRDSKYNWENADEQLIMFLSSKYNPDNYPKRTKEEKQRYFIMVNICQKINNILKNKLL